MIISDPKSGKGLEGIVNVDDACDGATIIVTSQSRKINPESQTIKRGVHRI